MLVHKPSRKLVLNLREPGRITALMPQARTLQHRGQTLVAVPHKLDEVRVLRNLGFDAPSPILSYYDWPGRQPYEHQRVTSAFLTLSQRAFCLNDMGTGKTLSVLWAFHYLRSVGAVDFAVVLAPLSALERAWGDEIFKSFFDLSFAVLHGTKERRLKLLEDDRDIYIVNHDGISRGPKDSRGRRAPGELLKALTEKMRGKKVLVVADELAVYRNSSSDRWWALNQLVKSASWVWGLTGTPTPNAPTDAWAQCRLIAPGQVPPYFGAFRERVMRQVTEHKWVGRDNALDIVHEVMQPSIRYSRAQCIDLPPTTYQTHQVELSPEQKKMYREMVAKFRTDYAGGQLTAANAAAKAAKLLQIVCGVAYGATGDIVIPAPARIELVREIIENASAKVIVFVPLTGALEHIAKELSKTYTVAVINGEVSKSKRDSIFYDFQNAKDPHVLVAQPGTMSHSLTLTAADTIIWFAPINSNEIYEQANARIPRPGQKLNTLIAHIEGSELERKMYDRLQKKGSAQGALLELFKEEDATAT